MPSWPAMPNTSAPISQMPKAYYYFEIAMGWLLVSIVIAGFSKFLGHAGED